MFYGGNMQVEIRIGNYRIKHTDRGLVWLENESGEALEIREYDFSRMIDKYFKEKL